MNVNYLLAQPKSLKKGSRYLLDMRTPLSHLSISPHRNLPPCTEWRAVLGFGCMWTSFSSSISLYDSDHLGWCFWSPGTGLLEGTVGSANTRTLLKALWEGVLVVGAHCIEHSSAHTSVAPKGPSFRNSLGPHSMRSRRMEHMTQLNSPLAGS